MLSMKRLLAAAFAVLSASCQLQPSASEQAVGTSLNAPQGKALICVYRPSKPFTGFGRRRVFIDKQHIASTNLGSFVAISVKPGTYTVQAAAPALWDTPEAHKAYPDIILNLRPGQSVFIKQYEGQSTGSGETMALQTGGGAVPIPMGGWYPPYAARVVDSSMARAECASLKQVGALELEGGSQ